MEVKVSEKQLKFILSLQISKKQNLPSFGHFRKRFGKDCLLRWVIACDLLAYIRECAQFVQEVDQFKSYRCEHGPRDPYAALIRAQGMGGGVADSLLLIQRHSSLLTRCHLLVRLPCWYAYLVELQGFQIWFPQLSYELNTSTRGMSLIHLPVV